MGMVRGVGAVGATGTAAARGFFNLFCFGGGARGALDAVLQARLLAQYRAMLYTSLERRRRSPSSYRHLTSSYFAARVASAKAKASPSQARIRCRASTAARGAPLPQSSPQYQGSLHAPAICRRRRRGRDGRLGGVVVCCCCWRRRKAWTEDGCHRLYLFPISVSLFGVAASFNAV